MHRHTKNGANWVAIHDEEISSELVDGFEPHREGATVPKVRLRWGRRDSDATDFLAGPLAVREESTFARVLASHATQPRVQGGRENNFEAQAQRQLGEGLRERRPVTFVRAEVDLELDAGAVVAKADTFSSLHDIALLQASTTPTKPARPRLSTATC